MLLAVNGAVLVGVGAFLAGAGSFLSGYAALRASRNRGKKENDKTSTPPSS